MRHNVPFYSQFKDVEDSYWAPRSCSIVNLKMIIDFYNIKSPDLIDLIYLANNRGFFGRSGWYHEGILKLGEELGLIIHREEGVDFEKGLKKIKTHLDEGGLIIASITKKILGNKRFHSILITGYEGDDMDLIYYHDPELLSGGNNKCFFVDKNTFENEWRKMAIFASKKA